MYTHTHTHTHTHTYIYIYIYIKIQVKSLNVWTQYGVKLQKTNHTYYLRILVPLYIILAKVGLTLLRNLIDIDSLNLSLQIYKT